MLLDHIIMNCNCFVEILCYTHYISDKSYSNRNHTLQNNTV